MITKLGQHTTPSLAGRVGVGLLLLFALPVSAQFRMNLGNDSPIRKLQIAEMAISNLYVDSVSEETLVEDGIRGMLEKLDPHSSYSTAKETKSMFERCMSQTPSLFISRTHARNKSSKS